MSSQINAFTPRARMAQMSLPLRQRLIAFWRWWRGELTALLPAQWIELSAFGGGGPLISLRDDEVILNEIRLGRVAEAERIRISSLDSAGQQLALRNLLTGRQAGSMQSVRLCLERTQYLRKIVSLPAATEENLRAVLGFEMDRHTPFKGEQVYFDYRILKRDSAQGLISVELTLMPKPALDALTSRVTALGGRTAAAVCIDDLTGAAPLPDLLGQAPKARPAVSRTRNLNLALAAALAVLIAIAVLIPIWQKRAAAIALLPKLSKAHAEADAVEAIHREMDRLVSESNYVLTRKHANPPVLSLIEDLSRALPDTTWVQLLEIKSGPKLRELVLNGETASSSKLIETIEQTGSLQNASFRSPLTKGMNPGTERFVLGAEIKTRALPAFVPENDLAPAPANNQPAAQATVPAAVPVTSPTKPGDAKPAPAAIAPPKQ
jgi:general secretion pathway protein L